MRMRRRDFLAAGAATVTGIGLTPRMSAQEGGGMFGLIGKMTATPGKRDELISILLDGTASMPGCYSYIVAKDVSSADAIWITEVWDSESSHKASLALPSVKEAIAKGKPLIAGFSDRFLTTPVGGHGLARPK